MKLTLKPEMWIRTSFEAASPDRAEDVVKYRAEGFPGQAFIDKDPQTTRWRISRDGTDRPGDFASAEEALAALEAEMNAVRREQGGE